MLATAYGGQAAARQRIQPYLQRLGDLARGRLILFVHDPYSPRQPFPDDFFNLVQRYSEYGPITDWVPDIQEQPRHSGQNPRTPEVEQMGVFVEPIARRLRLKIAYCSTLRIDFAGREPRLLLSGYREQARRQGTTVILSPEEIGVVIFTGSSDRFPDDLKSRDWFPVVNPPLLDQLLESKWLLPALLHDTPAVRRLPRSISVGMGFRTSEEVLAWGSAVQSPPGFPLAVLKPSHHSLAPGRRFLDRTALRALAARQPDRRLPAHLVEELLSPRVAHSYEEVSNYRGWKLLDNLLRTPGAEVHDRGDGTFHFSAPYPFLETTVSLLVEYVEARPIRSRRTGKLHPGTLRVVMFDGRIVSAVYRLGQEPDDGTFRDLTRPDVPSFYEGAAPEDETQLQAELGPFVEELERQFDARVRTPEDLQALRRGWILSQASR